MAALSNYRKGAVFGLTVAEIFILFTFVLLFALAGLVLDESDSEANTEDRSPAPAIWSKPEEIQTLHRETAMVQNEREQTPQDFQSLVDKLETAQQELELAQQRAEQAHKFQAEAEIVIAEIKRERDQAVNDLDILRRKGENPPCWYRIKVNDEGNTREQRLYAFNVAIYENGIKIGKREPPAGGAVDDEGNNRTYAEEWNLLRIDDLPYGDILDDAKFEKAIKPLYDKGQERQVRSYECVFSVQVWDKTPDNAKKRWQNAHDGLIEKYFNSYKIKDVEWKD